MHDRNSQNETARRAWRTMPRTHGHHLRRTVARPQRADPPGARAGAGRPAADRLRPGGTVDRALLAALHRRGASSRGAAQLRRGLASARAGCGRSQPAPGCSGQASAGAPGHGAGADRLFRDPDQCPGRGRGRARADRPRRPARPAHHARGHRPVGALRGHHGHRHGADRTAGRVAAPGRALLRRHLGLQLCRRAAARAGRRAGRHAGPDRHRRTGTPRAAPPGRAGGARHRERTGPGPARRHAAAPDLAGRGAWWRWGRPAGAGRRWPGGRGQPRGARHAGIARGRAHGPCRHPVRHEPGNAVRHPPGHAGGAAAVVGPAAVGVGRRRGRGPAGRAAAEGTRKRVDPPSVDAARGNVVQAARQLGISRATVYRKLGRR